MVEDNSSANESEDSEHDSVRTGDPSVETVETVTKDNDDGDEDTINKQAKEERVGLEFSDINLKTTVEAYQERGEDSDDDFEYDDKSYETSDDSTVRGDNSLGDEYDEETDEHDDDHNDSIQDEEEQQHHFNNQANNESNVREEGVGGS